MNNESRLKLISIDEIKKGIPGYDPACADEFHEASARIANKLFDDELHLMKKQNLQNKKN